MLRENSQNSPNLKNLSVLSAAVHKCDKVYSENDINLVTDSISKLDKSVGLVKNSPELKADTTLVLAKNFSNGYTDLVNLPQKNTKMW